MCDSWLYLTEVVLCSGKCRMPVTGGDRNDPYHLQKPSEDVHSAALHLERPSMFHGKTESLVLASLLTNRKLDETVRQSNNNL